VSNDFRREVRFYVVFLWSLNTQQDSSSFKSHAFGFSSTNGFGRRWVPTLGIREVHSAKDFVRTAELLEELLGNSDRADMT
jgi:hypothetical protein